MKLSVSVEIRKPTEDVWNTIIDFKNCSNYIESIVKYSIIFSIEFRNSSLETEGAEEIGV